MLKLVQSTSTVYWLLISSWNLLLSLERISVRTWSVEKEVSFCPSTAVMSMPCVTPAQAAGELG